MNILLEELDINQLLELDTKLKEAKVDRKKYLMEHLIVPCFSYSKQIKIKEIEHLRILGGELKLSPTNRKKLEEKFEVSIGEQYMYLENLGNKRSKITLRQAILILNGEIFSVNTVHELAVVSLCTPKMNVHYPFWMEESVEIVVEEIRKDIKSYEHPLRYSKMVSSDKMLTPEEKKEVLKTKFIPKKSKEGYHKKIVPINKRGFEYFINELKEAFPSVFIQDILIDIFQREQKGSCVWDKNIIREKYTANLSNNKNYIIEIFIKRIEDPNHRSFFKCYKNTNISGDFINPHYRYEIEVNTYRDDSSSRGKAKGLSIVLQREQIMIPEDIFVDFVENCEIIIY